MSFVPPYMGKQAEPPKEEEEELPVIVNDQMLAKQALEDKHKAETLSEIVELMKQPL